jgi:ubiquinone/menaquinone biosynthesis C-methylase UbiE
MKPRWTVYLPSFHGIPPWFLERYVKRTPKNGLVLDVGYGTGEKTSFVGRKTNRKVIGLDIIPETCRIASVTCKAPKVAEIVCYGGKLFPF